MTPSGIEPATFRFVAQHLNHCATADPSGPGVYGRTLAGIAGLESRRRHGCLSLLSVACCRVEVPASDTDCGMSECDRETSIVRKPWPARGCCAMEKENKTLSTPKGLRYSDSVPTSQRTDPVSHYEGQYS